MLKNVWNGVKRFVAIGESGPTPHGLKAGLKRVPVHLATMGVPSMVVALLIPPGPWKWIPAAIMVGQAVRGEIGDVQGGEDTVGKAVLDGLSQSALAVVGALL